MRAIESSRLGQACPIDCASGVYLPVIMCRPGFFLSAPSLGSLPIPAHARQRVCPTRRFKLLHRATSQLHETESFPAIFLSVAACQHGPTHASGRPRLAASSFVRKDICSIRLCREIFPKPHLVSARPRMFLRGNQHLSKSPFPIPDLPSTLSPYSPSFQPFKLTCLKLKCELYL